MPIDKTKYPENWDQLARVCKEAAGVEKVNFSTERKGEIMFDAILHREWIRGEADNQIIHYWAEDDSIERFEVPLQLRDQIVDMQNWLSKKQQKIDHLDRELARAAGFFED